ncbi:hypothetical protein BB560_004851 [Smittium megazygosporum]|uniref:NADH:flavin oxidoreductase/NADH oxidase N-terminal domain-containing protein n=1 Tax=Smittium megazygosporum TaxID=133381 RepID=A0A2T9Z832_9FUNG|nr:hypothetical protein BB560_004933 [Smittium megazygosporum]PVV00758.1 hypothetical protein BB560_004851 [Smittium megazygosporum]
MQIIESLGQQYQENPKDFYINQQIPPGSALGILDENGKTIPLTEAKKPLPISFTKFTQKSVTFNNRLVVSPMCTYTCQNGILNDWHIAHYGGFALQAPGAVIVEATAVQDHGRISVFCSGLWSDEHIEPHARVARLIKNQGVVAGIQLNHAGRKSSTAPPWIGTQYIVSDSLGGWKDKVRGPSPIPFSEEHAVPSEMTKEQIEETIQAFADAAARADKAGYDFIELHGAHGYLISQFLSSSSNQRTDEYGGSFENRCRFFFEIVKRIQSVWPVNKPIWARISCTEWVEGGWDLNDSIRLSKCLKDMGIDLIDCSSGGMNSKQVIHARPLFQTPFAEAIRKEVKIPTAAVGIITTSAQVEELLSTQKCDFVLLARQFLREPSFTKRAAFELGVDMRWPLQDERAKRNV